MIIYKKNHNVILDIHKIVIMNSDAISMILLNGQRNQIIKLKDANQGPYTRHQLEEKLLEEHADRFNFTQLPVFMKITSGASSIYGPHDFIDLSAPIYLVDKSNNSFLDQSYESVFPEKVSKSIRFFDMYGNDYSIDIPNYEEYLLPFCKEIPNEKEMQITISVLRARINQESKLSYFHDSIFIHKGKVLNDDDRVPQDNVYMHLIAIPASQKFIFGRDNRNGSDGLRSNTMLVTDKSARKGSINGYVQSRNTVPPTKNEPVLTNIDPNNSQTNPGSMTYTPSTSFQLPDDDDEAFHLFIDCFYQFLQENVTNH